MSIFETEAYSKLNLMKGIELIDDQPINNFYETVSMEDILHPACKNLLFRNTEDNYLLSFNNKNYKFRKVPLFSQVNRLIKYEGNATYLIINYKENDFYIGSSTCINNQVNKHKYLLTIGKHHNEATQNSYHASEQKDMHILIILMETPDDSLILEQALLDYFKDDPRKNNILNAIGDYPVYTKEEIRQKKSDSMKEVYANSDLATIHSNRMKEYWANPENKATMVLAREKAFEDPELAKKRADSMRKNMTENPEFIKARKDAYLAFRNDETRYNEWLTKRNVALGTAETREKMSISAKARFDNPSVGQAHSIKMKAFMSNQENKDRLRLGMRDKCKSVSIDGVVFDSLNLAAKYFNISKPGLKHRIESDNPKFENWIYVE